jgi:hypothetical protein
VSPAISSFRAVGDGRLRRLSSELTRLTSSISYPRRLFH